MPPIIILATNVLVAGLRSSAGASHALLRAVDGPHFRLGLTAALVLEYEDVLKRPGLVPVSAADVDVLLDHLCQIGDGARRHGIELLVPGAALARLGVE